MISNIFDLVKTEEALYKVTQIPVADGYEWNMADHINKCTMYKDGRLITGNSDDKPVKNIILPILNVNYRTEGFDVKDIEPYVDSAENYYKSFLIRKYHDRYALENQIDTFIDDVVESYVDYGGVFVKKVKDVRPEVIPLQKIAFCDQTDILSGPFAIKHQFSIDQLKERAGAWDKEAIDELIFTSQYEKTVSQSNNQEAKTPGKYIEIYEVHGCFPESWLEESEEYYDEHDEDNYVEQIHIISLQTDKDNLKKGICLYKGKEKKGLFKVLRRDKRFGTALGRSAIEELIEPQVWTNYSMIQIKNMLDKAGMMLGITDDVSFASKNKFTDLDQGEWLIKQPNTSVEPFVFPTVNLQQFEQATIQWEDHARNLGSANEATLGISPSSGTPFRLQDLVVNEGKGIHEYRRGKIASFIEEIYRDWIIPDLVNQINKGQKFLAELTLDELVEIAENVTTKEINDVVKKKILEGGVIDPEAVNILKEKAKADYLKIGNKRFAEILEDEFKDDPVGVFVNVAGKQKYLYQLVEKLTNIFRGVISNPQVLQDPNAAKVFNTILEASGISPINFIKTVPQETQGQELPSPQAPQDSIQEPQPVV